jgi:hypothetical protein
MEACSRHDIAEKIAHLTFNNMSEKNKKNKVKFD